MTDQWRVGEHTYVPYELAALYSKARHRILRSRVLRDYLDVLLSKYYASHRDHLQWLCTARVADIVQRAKDLMNEWKLAD